MRLVAVALAVLLCLLHSAPSHARRQASAPSVRRSTASYANLNTCFSRANNSAHPATSFTAMFNSSFRSRNCRTRLVDKPALRCHETYSYQAVKTRNFLDQDHEAASSYAEDFLQWILYYCGLTAKSNDTLANVHAFFCSMYFPPCHHEPIVPCRELCETVLQECDHAIKMLNFIWPVRLHCSNFPKGQAVLRWHTLPPSTTTSVTRAAAIDSTSTTAVMSSVTNATKPPNKRNLTAQSTRKRPDSLMTTRLSRNSVNSSTTPVARKTAAKRIVNGPLTKAAERLTTPTTITTLKTTTQPRAVRQRHTTTGRPLTKSATVNQATTTLQTTTLQTTTLQTTTLQTTTVQTTTQQTTTEQTTTEQTTVAPEEPANDSGADASSDRLADTEATSLSQVDSQVTPSHEAVQNVTSSPDAPDATEMTSTVSIHQYSPAAINSSEITLTTLTFIASKEDISQLNEQTADSLLQPLTKQPTLPLTGAPLIPPIVEYEEQVRSDPAESDANIYDSATEAELQDSNAPNESSAPVNVKPKLTDDDASPSVGEQIAEVALDNEENRSVNSSIAATRPAPQHSPAPAVRERAAEAKNQEADFFDEPSSGGNGMLISRLVCGFALVLHFVR